MKNNILGSFRRMTTFLFPSILFFLFSCGNQPKQSQQQGSDNKPQTPLVLSPDFNADSAYYLVKTQVDFGPRVNNTDAHKKCGDWIVNELKRSGAEVIEQKTIIPFEGKKLDVRNIIGSYNIKATKRILLCAHWDSRPIADKDVVDKDKPILGANDGASGVGVLLEIASVLKVHPLSPSLGIDIVFFDAEDLGNDKPNTYCLGSQYWSTHLHVPNYRAEYGILLDMVGGSNPIFAWEQNSTESAKPVVEKIWGIAQKLNYSNYFVYYQYGGIDDDHYYVISNAGIPTVDIIDFNPMKTPASFPDHHHTHRDNMGVIDRNTLKAVGQTVLGVIYSEK